MLLRFYRRNDSTVDQASEMELCFYVQISSALTTAEDERLKWFLQNPSDRSSFLTLPTVLEVGPRLHVETAYSSTAKTILSTVGVDKVTRIEQSRRFGFRTELSEEQATQFLSSRHDRMTEVRYPEPLTSFGTPPPPEPMKTIKVLGPDGTKNLLAFSTDQGLGWDDQDLEFGRWLYQDFEKRNGSDTELFGLGQARCDHSRHLRFNALYYIDGVQKAETLMKLIKRPLVSSNSNSVIAFHDNASAIRGHEVKLLVVEDPRTASKYVLVIRIIHPTLTAESHNHPSMIDPYQGFATLIAIIRDQETVGRGGRIGVLGIGMGVGNLHIPGYLMPWEQDGWKSVAGIATPLQIALRGSQGAFDFANAFGQPAIYGFFRTFGQVMPSGEYRSWYKPVAYGVAAGFIDDAHIKKTKPEKGMVVALAGGPAYCVGVGGGSGSSMLGGESSEKLDFNSVQRGDGEMQNRLDHFTRGCIEMLDDNPQEIVQDLGAGGLINSGLEISNKAGLKIRQQDIPSADPSLSSRELLGNESQERNLIVYRKEKREVIHGVAERESCPLTDIGEITGDGRFVVEDSVTNTTPVDLPLSEVLGDSTPKTFRDVTIRPKLQPLVLPLDVTIGSALDRVLRLPAVASKQWLTRRMDRSVTGLVAQQQCVGPNHLPLSDFAIRADSYFGKTGTAYSLGEQPNTGLLSPGAMVRLAVTEALLNIVGARITDLRDIKGSTNWMLAAKIPGQSAWLYEAMEQLVVFMEQLGIASDGGKDSTSHAGQGISPDGQQKLVVSPGEFIFAPYAKMPDITRKVTPYIRHANTQLLYVDLGMGKNRLGGSALAQVYGQIGDESPDMENADLLARTFRAIQELLDLDLLEAAHDRSDGGLATTLLEMGFASNLGIEAWLDGDGPLIDTLFSQEPGIVLGCNPWKVTEARAVLEESGVPVEHLGLTSKQTSFRVYRGSKEVYNEDLFNLRVAWEETSYQLDRLLRNPECSEAEKRNTVYLATVPPYRVTFIPPVFPSIVIRKRPKVAILREEGSNGEREMGAMFTAAGFDSFDVNMRDLAEGFSLASFRGVALVGGFSFRDVFGAGRGWAGVIRFNERIRAELERFRNREDTFGLGICNGCQGMGELGWVPGRFVQNKSRIFESRFSTVGILESDIMFFRDMAGSKLGIWLAHGEGQHECDSETLAEILKHALAPVRFLDPKGEVTTNYPFNPNGSAAGIAGVASFDKRFFAMMPHAERTGQMTNWPWAPEGWEKYESSPWFKLFTNAREWCKKN